MKKIINIIIGIVLLIMCIMNCFLANRLADKTEELIELTDVEPELIIVDSVKFDTVFIERYDSVRLTKCQVDTLVINDTVVAVDSVDVIVPIELKHYNDTLSRTAISFGIKGFQCEVKDLCVQNLIVCPDQEKPLKTNRFGLGLQLGIGVNEKGFTHYIGIGFSYNIFSF